MLPTRLFFLLWVFSSQFIYCFRSFIWELFGWILRASSTHFSASTLSLNLLFTKAKLTKTFILCVYFYILTIVFDSISFRFFKHPSRYILASLRLACCIRIMAILKFKVNSYYFCWSGVRMLVKGETAANLAAFWWSLIANFISLTDSSKLPIALCPETAKLFLNWQSSFGCIQVSF